MYSFCFFCASFCVNQFLIRPFDGLPLDCGGGVSEGSQGPTAMTCMRQPRVADMTLERVAAIGHMRQFVNFWVFLYEIIKGCKNTENMQCQDVKNIVSCCLFFFEKTKQKDCRSQFLSSTVSFVCSMFCILRYFFLYF